MTGSKSRTSEARISRTYQFVSKAVKDGTRMKNGQNEGATNRRNQVFTSICRLLTDQYCIAYHREFLQVDMAPCISCAWRWCSFRFGMGAGSLISLKVAA